jgi:nucleotide-binding universal stress UspA family protein
MKKNKYKILVLSDLKKSANSTLKSTISLAKMIHGDIEFFHVKKPTDILEKDNQLSAFRTINLEHNATSKKIEDLVKPFSDEFGVNINYNYRFGNVKNEIAKHIEETKPDIIVLGKRKLKSINVFGDKLTQFVLKKHHGVIMIAAKENTLEPNEKLSLGLLNSKKQVLDLEFAEDLMGHTQAPLKSFNIVKNSSDLKEAEVLPDTKTVEYVFEANDNIINNLSSYLIKNNINLLCIGNENEQTKSKSNRIRSEVNALISKLDVSLLFTGEQKQSLQ